MQSERENTEKVSQMSSEKIEFATSGQLNEAELEELQKMTRAYFIEMGSDEFFRKDEMAESVFVVAKTQGKLVGFVYLGNKGKNLEKLTYGYVAPDFRRTGIMSKMFHAARRLAQKEGKTTQLRFWIPTSGIIKLHSGIASRRHFGFNREKRKIEEKNPNSTRARYFNSRGEPVLPVKTLQRKPMPR